MAESAALQNRLVVGYLMISVSGGNWALCLAKSIAINHYAHHNFCGLYR